MTMYFMALTPLLVAVTALVVALPLGLHYAKKERLERQVRAETEAREQAVPILGKYELPSTLGYYSLIETGNTFFTVFGQEPSVLSQTPSQPQAARSPIPLRRRQPAGELADVA